MEPAELTVIGQTCCLVGVFFLANSIIFRKLKNVIATFFGVKMRSLSTIKDYTRALELGKGKGVDEEPYLGLARCYALQGKFREAAEYLDRAPISVKTLHELAEDPDFAEMVADKRGRESFHLPEDENNARNGSSSNRGGRK